jgi:hypothetical protein
MVDGQESKRDHLKLIFVWSKFGKRTDDRKSNGGEMDVEVVLDTGGAAVAGVDRDALIADMQAELNKLASAAGTTTVQPKQLVEPSPVEGAAWRE